MKLIKGQFPLRRGLCFAKEGPKSLCEINFPQHLHNEIDRACTDGLRFEDRTIIIAAPALESSTKLARLNLSRLPFKDEADLLSGLRQSLEHFGRFLDLGICREPNTQTYMGTGYDVLDVTPRAGSAPFLTLSHVLQWADSTDGFHAIWGDMAIRCRYCH